MIAKVAETFLSLWFIIPFAVIVGLLAGVILYITHEQGLTNLYQQGVKEMTESNYAKARALFEKFALDNPSHKHAQAAVEEARFCSLMAQVQGGAPDPMTLVRQAEGFLSAYPKSGHASKVKEIIQQTLYDEADRLYQEGKRTHSVDQLQKALPLLDKALAVNPLGPLVSQMKELAVTVHKEMKILQEKAAFAQAKKRLLAQAEPMLKARKFAALRAEVAGITTKFEFAAQDSEICALLNSIKEKELAASSFIPTHDLPAQERAVKLNREPNTLVLLQRQIEGHASGVEGEIVFLLAKGRCLALEAATGQCRWSALIGADSILPVIVRNTAGKPQGALVALPVENALCMVNLADGSPKWSYRSAAPFICAPLVYQSLVYLPTLNDGIHVLKLESGALLGKFWIDGEIRHPPVLDEERRVLYVLPENGCIYVISLAQNACMQILSNVFEPYLLPWAAVVVGDYLLLVEYQGLKAMRAKIFVRDEEGLNLRPIRVSDFDIGQNIGCRPAVAQGALYSISEAGALMAHGVNVRSEDAPLYPAAAQWPPTFLSGNYALLRDTESSPFAKGVSGQTAVLACGNGVAVYRLDAPNRKLEELWRFPPGGQNPSFIPGEACLPPQRVGNLICVTTISADMDGVFLSAIDLDQRKMAWQVAAGAAAGEPVLDEGGRRVFVRNALGSLYAAVLPAQESATLLDRPLVAGRGMGDSPLAPPLFVSPGRLHVVLEDNMLHALDAQTGTPIVGWEEPFPTQATPGPLAPFGADALAFGTQRGGVFIVPLAHARSECQEFTDPTRTSYAVRPMVASDGTIYIGNQLGQVYKLVLAEQAGRRYLKAETRYKTSAPIRAGAVLLDDVLYVGDTAGKVYALSAQNLTRQAEWDLDAPITSDLVVAGDIVLAASEAGCVYGITSRAKKIAWRFPKDGFVAAVKGRPLCIDEIVLIGTEDGNIYALECATGHAAWRLEVGGKISAGIAVVRRQIVVPRDDGSVRFVPLPAKQK